MVRQRTLAGDRQRRQAQQWREKLAAAQNRFQIAIDCSFQHLLREREIASLAQQLRYCYSYNKNSATPCLVTVTSVNGLTRTLLEKEVGCSTWHQRGFTCTEWSLEDYFSEHQSSLVYLTSDSATILEHLEDDKIYVIGGIVDRNRLKGIALARATQELGVATAKLPLDEHLSETMPSTQVLACNHVFDILIKYREFGNDWAKALQFVLPPRKGAKIQENKVKKDEISS